MTTKNHKSGQNTDTLLKLMFYMVLIEILQKKLYRTTQTFYRSSSCCIGVQGGAEVNLIDSRPWEVQS